MVLRLLYPSSRNLRFVVLFAGEERLCSHPKKFSEQQLLSSSHPSRRNQAEADKLRCLEKVLVCLVWYLIADIVVQECEVLCNLQTNLKEICSI